MDRRLNRWRWQVGVGVVLTLLITALAGASTTCTTRWDAAFQIYRTECTDGSVYHTREDKGFQRWRTEQTRPPKAPAGTKGK
jgi:hypothetical protein